MCKEAAGPGVKAQRGDAVGDRRVGSGKRAVEGLWDQPKHLNPSGGRRAREKGHLMEQKLEKGGRGVKSPAGGTPPGSTEESRRVGSEETPPSWAQTSQARETGDGGCHLGQRGGASAASTCRRAGRAAQV